MKLSIVPLEERILLDAAAAATVAGGYEAESATSERAQQDQAAHQQAAQGPEHGVMGNSEAVDGRILVISSQIENAGQLLDAAHEQGQTSFVYDFNTSLTDLAQQITDATQGEKVSSIGFAMMGADGKFALTSDVLVSLQSLSDNPDIQSFWKSVGGMVKDGGSIDILSCNTAVNAEGLTLVTQLDNIVDNASADHYVSINASIDKTGSSDLGGDWILEVGQVNALDRYFDSSSMNDWSGVLDAPYRIADIVSGSGSSNPDNFTQVGNLTFFTATTSAAGTELWVTDGTEAGTYMVKDIRSGSNSSSPTDFVDLDGTLYFTASNGSDVSLWKSDGTSAGTVQVKDIRVGGNDAVASLTKVGSTLFFSATTSAQGAELWKSDGTEAGTVLVKDIRSGSQGSTPAQFVTDGTTLYFTANNGSTGVELWKSDGTNAGTVLVKDIRPGGQSSVITSMTAIGDYVYFSARDSNSRGYELWRSDGTSAGTVLIKDIQSGSGSSTPSNFTSFAGKVFFTATTNANGIELYSTDGTSAGTTMVKEIAAGSTSSTPTSLTVAGGKLFFAANDAVNGIELWVSDGTNAGTTLVKNINTTSSSSSPASLVAVGSKVYFAATDSAGGRELWVSDGTSAGTVRVADINAGGANANPDNLKLIGTTLYFSATDGSSGTELWAFDTNSPPVGGNKSYSGTEDTVLTVNAATGVLNGASDPDGNPITAVLVSNGTKGTVVLNANGSFTYTPNANANGTDTFTYQIKDSNNALSAVYTATLTIGAVNDAPVAQNSSITTSEDTPISGSVSFTDVETPLNQLVASVVDQPAHGTLVFNADGTYTYTPDANFNGSDSFTYKVSDGSLDSGIQTVAITIGAVNDAPVAQDSAITTSEDTPISGSVSFTDVETPLNQLVASVVDQPSHGTLVFNADGTYTYTPDANFNGSDSFTYKVSDGALDSGIQTVAITIGAVNDAPVAQDSSITTSEDTPISGSVSFTDVETPLNQLVASVVDQPAHGTLVFNADGTYTYTPDANFNGSDSFTYKVSDGSLDSGIQTVAITIGAVNDAPVAQDSAITTSEDTPISGSVSFTDVETPLNQLVASVVDQPSHGTLVFNADGTYTYTPDANFNGSDSFTYKVSDGSLDSGIQTVSITIGAVNDAPVAQDSAITTSEDTPISGSVSFTDVETPLNQLVASVVDQPSHGTLVFNADGTYTYTPDANFNGSDSFTYKVNDGALDSGIQTVAITINAVNDAPVAQDSAITTSEDTPISGSVSFTDVETPLNQLVASVVDQPAHGTLVFNADGTYTYTPDANFNGSDSFTYKVSDGSLDSGIQTVSITIGAVNDAPVAQDSAITTSEDTPISGSVSFTDVETPLNQLVASVVDQPAHGTLVFNADGTYTYTPDANFNGSDSFTYKVSDGSLDSGIQTVAITIGAVNDAPVAQDSAITTSEDTPISGSVSFTDVETPLNQLVASVVDQPAHGTLVFNADGTYTYTPDANFNGSDSFTYKVSDGSLDSGIQTVSITIGAVNDAPVAQDSAITTSEDTPISGSVSFTDVETPLNQLVASVVDQPSHGTLVFNADGTYTYTPDANFNGSDSFTYKVSDGALDSGIQTVSITIGAVNDAPVAQDSAITTSEDTPISGSVSFTDVETPLNQLVASVVDQPAHGTLVFNADGTYTYTPDANFNGSDSFTYKVSDGALDSGIQTVAITIGAVNDAPVAQDSAITTSEDTPISGSVSFTDVETPLNQLVASVVDQPTHGTLVFNADGTYTYTPDANFNGSDSFTYKVSDGSLDSGIQTVAITIAAVNDAPVAQDSAITTSEDTPISGSVSFTDVETPLNQLVASVVDQPAHGTLVFNADGTYTYTPDANFNGSDSFTYKVSDGSLDSGIQTVAITINAVNDAPVAQDSAITTSEDTPISGSVSFTDVETPLNQLVASVVDQPAHGTLVFNADGTYTYTPDANFNGSDSFTYKVSDGSLDSGIQTVAITIAAVNDAPVAQDSAITTSEDTPISGSVSFTDVETPLNQLVASVVDQPSHGTLVFNADGTYTYTPDANFNGSDSFTYKVSDGALDSGIQTVAITIGAVNDAPVAQDSAITTSEDTPISGSVSFTDVETPLNQLVASVVDQPSHGTLVFNADGTYTYTPDANFNGSDSFTYKVSDGALDSGIQTVAITIGAVNDAPVAQDSAITTSEDTPISGSVSFTDVETPLNQLVASVVDQPSHGTLVFNADGTYTYTPDANFNGSDSFTYKVSDGALDSGIQTVAITIAAVNDAPVAQDSAITTSEDTPISGSVSFTDVETPLNQLVASVVDQPAHGTLVFNADGTYTYTPDANFNGSDSFTYKVSDGDLDSGIQTVAITIAAVNDAPVAQDSSITTSEDTPISGSVSFTDVETPLNQLVASVVDQPSHGTLVFNADGTYTYTPDANFNGSDSFTYKVNDGSLDSGIQTVAITIGAVNDAPVAQDSSITTSEDTPISGSVSFTDVETPLNQLVASVVDQPSHGTLVFNADGTYTYTPDANFNGSDSFTYKVSDGALDSGIQTVSITIGAVNDAPVAQDSAITTSEDTPISGSVSFTDVETPLNQLVASVVDQPSHGTLVFNADGTYTYTPDANFNGSDSFTYKVSDGSLDSGIQTVAITINAVNDAPVAQDSAITTSEDTPISGSVSFTDVETPLNQLVASVVDQPAHGTLVFNADGTYTYTPDANFNGSDSFTYKVSDGALDSGIQTVAITIGAVNDAPVAQDSAITTSEDTPISGSVSFTDVETPLNQLVASVVDQPAHGTLVFNADGTYTYTPDANFNGSDSFTYKVSDGSLDSGIQTVAITIGAVNDAPVAQDSAITTSEDTPISGSVSFTDVETPLNQLVASVVDQPAHGTLVFNADGTYTYTPDANFNGSDSFTYKVSDGSLDSGIQTVAITINAVNDAPVAQDSAITTSEDTPISGSVSFTDVETPLNQLVASVVDQPAHGTLVFNADGTYTYTPDANFNGSDSFTYKVSDGSLDSGIQTVAITIGAVNDAPVAQDSAITTSEDTPISGSVSFTDVETPLNQLVASVVDQPAHGTLVFNADGTYTYTPDANFNGSDSFTYKVSDGSLDSGIQTVAITINAVNDAPVAQDSAITTSEDTPISGSVSFTDVETPLNQLVASVVDQPAHGTLVFNADGTYTYTPDANFNGSDSFTYKVSDGSLDSGIQTVAITIGAVNDAPVAQDSAIMTSEDTPISGSVSFTDVETPLNQLVASVVDQPAHGTLVFNADGTYTYTPDANFNGSDSFTYKVSDGSLDSGIQTVAITIGAVNDAPVAQDSAITTSEDTPISGSVSFTDVETPLNQLVASVVDQPAHGTLVFNADGTYTYTPDANFNGSDSFTYKVSDGDLDSGIQTVAITINAVNDAPVAQDSAIMTSEDTPISGSVSFTDVETPLNQLVASVVDQPAHGTLVFNADGTYTYTPDANFNGSDSFTYKVSDGSLDSGIQTVAITIGAVNDAPVAQDSAITTSEDTPISGSVSFTDVETPLNQLVASVVDQPAHGTLVFNADGTYTYTPDANFNGSDSFTYKVSDGSLDSGIQTVAITINAVNDAPVAQDSAITTSEDTPISGSVSFTDVETPLNQLVASVVDQPAHGTLVFNADGTYTYTPDANFNGSDSFTYKVSDGSLDSGIQTVAITIGAVNDAPVAQDSAITTSEDTPISGSVSFTDVETPLNQLVASVVDQPAHGTLVFNADGTYTYTPDANFNGSDSFTYKVSDGSLDSGIQTVAITINAVNDAPVAQDSAITTSEDTPISGSVSFTDVETPLNQLVASVVDQPAHGTLVFNADGTYTYTPDANFNGSDSFTYKVSDGSLDSGIQTVAITIGAVNDAPVAQDSAIMTSEDTPISGSVSFTDVETPLNQLVASVVDQPAHGTLVFNADGTYTYTPDANFNGSDSFTYKVSDGSLDSGIQTVAITIGAVNDAPVAQDSAITTSEDTPISGSVSFTDVETPLNQLVASVVDQPAHGTLVFNADGTYTYTPDANFNGSDSFTYKVSDGDLDSGIQTVAITINAVNDAPVAQDSAIMTSEDTPISGSVSFTDVETPLNQLVASVVDQPAHGTLVFNADGTYTYTPDANFNGSDSFTYKVSDGSLDSGIQTVAITIGAVNDAPVAQDSAITTSEDTPISGSVSFTDVETPLNQLVASVVDQPAHGTLVFNADGTYTYTPDANFNGSDSFTYKVSDGDLDSGIQTVAITIAAVNDAPVAQDSAITTSEDTPISGSVSFTDVETPLNQLVASVVDQPSHGTLVFNADGTYTYTPDANFNGSDSFTYKVSDGALDSGIQTVAITIGAVNDAPVAQDSAITTSEDTPISGSVSFTDVETPLNQLVASVVDQPSHGTLVFNADGTYTYTPDANFNGSDSFTYKVSDGALDSGIQTVAITIGAVNDAPVAQDSAITTSEDTPISGSVSFTDVETPLNQLVASVVDQPSHGTLVFNADGTYTYTPDANFNGSDSFTYKVSDGALDSGIQTVAITIAAVNDAPVAQDSAITTSEDTPISGSVSFTDVETPLNQLVASVVDQPSNGTLVFNADGTYTYTPDANFNGSDSFTYKVSDGALDSGIQTVSITIGAVNDAPVAQDSAITTSEDTPISGSVSFTDVETPLNQLVASVVDQPSHGTLVFNADGTYTYTPDANFNGSDSFTYKVSDGSLDSGIQTVAITIGAVNDAPVAQDSAITTSEDTPISGSVSFTDVETPLNQLVASVVDQPAHGTLVFNADGTYTYTPDANFNGSDSFTYKVSDGSLDSGIQTVAITIGAVNDAPVAQDSAITTSEDTPISGSVSFTDVETPLNQLVASVVDQPAHGTLVFNADGTYTYTPDANFNGSDSFTYKVSDGDLDSGIQTVAITINAVNDAPVAQDSAIMTSEDTPISGSVSFTDVETPLNQLVASVVDQPAHGTLVFNADGTYTYTPDANFNGSDSFTYKVSDGSLDSGIQTVAITIGAVNDAPVAQDSAITTSEDTPISGSVSFTDVETPLNQLVASVVDQPAHGTLVFNADGTYTYTPDANFNGSDSFTYKVSDGSLDSGIQTVAITINAVNDAPVAQDSAITTSEDTPISGSVSFTDVETPLNQLVASVVDQPAHGTLVFNADGTYTYTPDANFNGSDSFTYKVSDGSLDSGIQTVAITIGAVNDAPVAQDSAITTSEDTPISGSVSFTDVETPLNQLVASVVDQPAHGTLVFNADGTYTYTPDANFNGSDSFTYKVSDGSLDSGIQTVAITINAVNDAPVAQDSAITTSEDTPISGSVSFTDVETPLNQLVASVVDQPAHGTLVFNADGTYTYTPDANFNGSDSFTYKVSDGSLDSGIQTVAITIGAVNDAPVAQDSAITTSEDTPISGSVSFTDVETPLNQLVASVVDQPSHGTLVFNADGTYTYTPDANFNGSDSFTYKVSDGSLDSGIQTVSITIGAVNDAPVAQDSAITTSEDTPISGSVSFTDVETPLNQLVASVVDQPAHGTLVFNADGTYTYTPDANFNGSDSFTYKVSDGSLDSGIQTVSITIGAVNDAPVAQDSAITTSEDTPISGSVSFTDVETPLNQLVASVVDQPAHGTLVFNADGTYTYTPDANFNGSDSFTYKVSDGALDSGIQTVAITIGAVNDAPVAQDSAITTSEDTPISGSVSFTDVETPLNQLVASVVDQPAHGTLVFNADGTYTYTPDANFNGSDSFTYKVSEGALDSGIQTVAITINAVNDAPVAQDSAITTSEDTPISGSVSFTDVETPLNQLVASVVDQPAHGTLVFNADGTYTYTPDANFNGSDSFTYKVSDGALDSGIQTVAITIGAVNDAPVAQDSAITTSEDTPISGSVSFTDVETPLNQLVASVVDQPAHGTLVFNADGTYTYTPDANFNGSDSFTYKVSDGALDSGIQTVAITINAVNDAPVAQDSAITTSEDTPISGSVSFTDVETPLNQLVASVVDQPSHGTLVFNADGTYTYTPDANFNGSDSFTYKVSDGALDSGIQTVSITIGAVNDAPVAQDSAITTSEDTPISGSVSFTDVETPLNQLVASVVDQPAHGTLVFNADGTYTYTPDANFNGSDSFTYKVSDGSLDSGIQTVAITINAVNDAPVANDAFAATNEDTQLNGSVAFSDIETDINSLVASVVDLPANGSLSFGADGTYTYTPNPDFNGVDTFTYRVSDGDLFSDVKTVTITVGAVNDAPVANDGSAITSEDTPVNGVVSFSDVDNNLSSLVAMVIDNPTNGSLLFNTDGTYTYTPNPDFNGIDTFTYSVSDGTLFSDVKTITITVGAVNDAPVANDVSVTTDQTQSLSGAVSFSDIDTDINSLIASVVDQPAHGTLIFNANGTFTYTPNPIYDGPDSFTYRVSDGNLFSEIKTVSITVNRVENPTALIPQPVDTGTLPLPTVASPAPFNAPELPAIDTVNSEASESVTEVDLVEAQAVQGALIDHHTVDSTAVVNSFENYPVEEVIGIGFHSITTMDYSILTERIVPVQADEVNTQQNQLPVVLARDSFDVQSRLSEALLLPTSHLTVLIKDKETPEEQANKLMDIKNETARALRLQEIQAREGITVAAFAVSEELQNFMRHEDVGIGKVDSKEARNEILKAIMEEQNKEPE